MNEQTTALTLPDEQTFRHDMEAINRFQCVVRATMVSGQDYGVIPGTQKPTLLKPGAEKIAKLLGLADQYEIVDRQENWDAGFFRYLVKCRLANINTGYIISEGMGECNSMESKYRWRWVFASQLPAHLIGDTGKVERDKLVSREIGTRNGKAKQYRLDNDDVYSQVNTILKMAKKRALVDAALSAGRLSQVFTQDIEDLGPMPEEAPAGEPPQPEPVAKPASEKPKPAPVAATDGADPSTIKTFGDLYTACQRDFKMDRAAVLRELGVTSQQAISDTPAECYIAVKAGRE